MYIDSHCHLDFPELAQNLPSILSDMQAQQVTHALCVSVDLKRWDAMMDLIAPYPQLFASVGVHPDYKDAYEPTVEELVRAAEAPKVVAIGETGLDYFKADGDLEWQRKRFVTHIQAAKKSKKPLIVHTREASADTIRLLQEEQAHEVGGVLHCFTETIEMAQAAMEMNFYISFSGIITFKNAIALQEVVQQVPLDKILIETDSPFLAPVPFRGKTNDPSKVVHIAEKIAELKKCSVSEVAQASTHNFKQLFKVPA